MSRPEPKEESELEALDLKIRQCVLCKLCEARTNAVPGNGKTGQLKLMIVGEAPGRNEDLAGKPFVGAGGKLLDTLLENAGLKRDQVYITNIVKCRPPNNRKPEKEEVSTCTSNYLDRQIELLKPKLICTLGATALQYFTGEKVIGKFHGKLMRGNKGHLIFPTYHPASIFRNISLKGLLEKDLKEIEGILAERD
ncbi:MAG: uracil-DNA glycosylase [Nitrososphaerales archaeon]